MMTKKPAKRSGSPKPSNTEGETAKPVEAEAQMLPKQTAESAGPVRSKRPKAAPDQTAPAPKRYRRNLRDSIYLYLKQVEIEERLKAAEGVEYSKTLH